MVETGTSAARARSLIWRAISKNYTLNPGVRSRSSPTAGGPESDPASAHVTLMRRMRLAKLAVAAVGPTVGAIKSNVERLIEIGRAMSEANVTVGAFPEQCIGGYPPEDLVQWPALLAAQRSGLETFARQTNDTATVYVVGLALSASGQVFNAAAVVHRGRIAGAVPKEKLPTYKGRTFSRGGPGFALDWGGVPFGDYRFDFEFGGLAVEVCEDAWSPDGPMRRRCYSGATIVANISASPYRMGIQSTRREMLATRSADNQATLLYANTVGGQDSLIHEGGGFVFDNGRLVLEAPRFVEGWWSVVADLDRTKRLRMENTTWRTDSEAFHLEGKSVPVITIAADTARNSALNYPELPGGNFFLPGSRPTPADPRDAALDDLFEALAVGVKSYYQKTGIFKSLGIALSGGRDSMLTLVVAWRTSQLLHNVPIFAFYMPSKHSGAATKTAADVLATELGVVLQTNPIHDAIERETEATIEMLGGDRPTELTRQNIQARIRAQRMWNWANSSGALFLQTGDMSEKAVGYTTIGGDLEGSLSVIANVPKTVVIALLERLHTRFGFKGIAATLGTDAGPELADKQVAENELMPFPILDACLYLYAGEKMATEDVVAALTGLFPQYSPDNLAVWAKQFTKLFSQSIYKWVQSPLSLHVGSLDLDRERALQMPVVQRNEWP